MTSIVQFPFSPSFSQDHSSVEMGYKNSFRRPIMYPLTPSYSPNWIYKFFQEAFIVLEAVYRTLINAKFQVRLGSNKTSSTNHMSVGLTIHTHTMLKAHYLSSKNKKFSW